MKKTIAVIVGTVPEAVKLGPVCQELAQHHDSDMTTRVILTGQHRDRVVGILRLFGISPSLTVEDDIIRDTLSALTSSLVSVLAAILWREHPDVVVVQGDTATAFAAAVAAFYDDIPVAHVEAGLTTGNVAHPFPEEMHREVISKIATLLFAPSPRAADHAQKIARPGAQVYLTGNPGVDALILKLNGKSSNNICGRPARKRILITVHRRENHGSRGERIGSAIAQLASDRADVEIVYVGHNHPRLLPLTELFRRSNHLTVLPPQEYTQWLGLLRDCHFVLSDSGGVQEEAPWLGKPVLVLRDETERMEVVEGGAAKLVGSDPQKIYESAIELLDDEETYRQMQMSWLAYPYGRGNAAPKIRQHLLDWLAKTNKD
jgi:UDP-N-acetylglucosamine 2-epimerase (non-hydrolysing)